MSLHDLADLLLCLFHAADIGKPLRWHIGNQLHRLRGGALHRTSDGDGNISRFLFRSRQ